ncbi:Hsp20/alpha crystallin family protein [Candidatus Pacearchaeota archaeon]|nr:Hsp20/alpha crystallin family protein [Candidatus Pacearchaeota archaeon]
MADWFNDDPFDGIFEEFFGRGRPGFKRREKFIVGEDEERTVDVIEVGDKAYLIFELPGFDEEDVSINTKGKTIEISIEKKNVDGIKEYLAQKLASGLKYARKLPDSISPKNFSYSLKNGILEIKFDRM